MHSLAGPDVEALRFGARQHALFVSIAFSIWLTGVIVLRLLPEQAFDMAGPGPVLLFAASIGIGIGTQAIVPVLVRLPMQSTLVPVAVIAGSALMMDGIAIGFTDIYTADDARKIVVAGWLLWTFGSQLVISLVMIARSSRSGPGS